MSDGLSDNVWEDDDDWMTSSLKSRIRNLKTDARLALDYLEGYSQSVDEPSSLVDDAKTILRRMLEE